MTQFIYLKISIKVFNYKFEKEFEKNKHLRNFGKKNSTQIRRLFRDSTFKTISSWDAGRAQSLDILFAHGSISSRFLFYVYKQYRSLIGDSPLSGQTDLFHESLCLFFFQLAQFDDTKIGGKKKKKKKAEDDSKFLPSKIHFEPYVF